MGEVIAFPKNPRQVSRRYLDFIRSKPCAGCGSKLTAPHHTLSRAAWGSDFRTIPFCSKCHEETHRKGLLYTEKTRNFNHLDVIIKLLSEYVGQFDGKIR